MKKESVHWKIICYSEGGQSGGVEHIRKTGLCRRGTQPHTYSRGDQKRPEKEQKQQKTKQ